MSEWLIEPVSKTGVPFAGTAGSNPALSDLFVRNTMYYVLLGRNRDSGESRIGAYNIEFGEMLGAGRAGTI